MILLVGRVGTDTLELSDGWYSLPCPLNYGDPLHQLVKEGIVITIVKPYKIIQINQTLNFLFSCVTFFSNHGTGKILKPSFFHLQLS